MLGQATRSTLRRALEVLTRRSLPVQQSKLCVRSCGTRHFSSAGGTSDDGISPPGVREFSSEDGISPPAPGDPDGASPPLEEMEEYEPRMEHKLDKCESWVHDLVGNKEHLVTLKPGIFGLPPRTDILIPVVLRQLKYKIQDQPYGSEENNFINFDRLQDRLYIERPELKPWIRQGISWKQQGYTHPTEMEHDSTTHMPVPHYNGSVPLKLRQVGLRVLLSLKYRYDKLHLVSDLATTSRYLQPDEFRGMLDENDFTSVLMITGNHITPHFKSSQWKRKEPFPAPHPGTQRLWKTASLTTGCELREVDGLDVWSALLYDTLVLDMAAVNQLQDMLPTAQFTTGNISLRNTLEGGVGSLGAAAPRHKVVRIVNMDNL